MNFLRLFTLLAALVVTVTSLPVEASVTPTPGQVLLSNLNEARPDGSCAWNGVLQLYAPLVVDSSFATKFIPNADCSMTVYKREMNDGNRATGVGAVYAGFARETETGVIHSYKDIEKFENSLLGGCPEMVRIAISSSDNHMSFSQDENGWDSTACTKYSSIEWSSLGEVIAHTWASGNVEGELGCRAYPANEDEWNIAVGGGPNTFVPICTKVPAYTGAGNYNVAASEITSYVATIPAGQDIVIELHGA